MHEDNVNIYKCTLNLGVVFCCNRVLILPFTFLFHHEDHAFVDQGDLLTKPVAVKTVCPGCSITVMETKKKSRAHILPAFSIIFKELNIAVESIKCLTTDLAQVDDGEHGHCNEGYF